MKFRLDLILPKRMVFKISAQPQKTTLQGDGATSAARNPAEKVLFKFKEKVAFAHCIRTAISDTIHLLFDRAIRSSSTLSSRDSLGAR